jgi:RNA polymerase sigma-70 factor, ECF subfamily
MSDDLTGLLLAARDGDRVALSAWIHRTQGEVLGLCRSLANPDDAEDVAQDVYLRAYRALPRFRGESSARTWLLVIARATCADFVRASRRRRRLALRASAPSHEPDPTGTVEVHLMLRALKPDRRAAFALTQVIRTSYAEAAEICDCSIGTIRSRVARARDDLRRQLAVPHAGDRSGLTPHAVALGVDQRLTLSAEDHSVPFPLAAGSLPD